jgi:hypothetical protein
MANDVSQTTDRFCDSCRGLACIGFGRLRPTKFKNPEGVEKWFCDICFDYFLGPTEIEETENESAT